VKDSNGFFIFALVLMALMLTLGFTVSLKRGDIHAPSCNGFAAAMVKQQARKP
jgi:hypothetical protein